MLFYYPLVLILWYQHDHISYKFFIFSRHSTVSNILILCLRYAEYFNQGAQCQCNMLACMSYNCGTKEARNVRFHYFYYYLFSLYCPLLLMCILSMLWVSCGSAGQRNSVRIFFSFLCYEQVGIIIMIKVTTTKCRKKGKELLSTGKSIKKFCFKSIPQKHCIFRMGQIFVTNGNIGSVKFVKTALSYL